MSEDCHGQDKLIRCVIVLDIVIYLVWPRRILSFL